jgi:hypothetical protein
LGGRRCSWSRRDTEGVGKINFENQRCEITEA